MRVHVGEDYQHKRVAAGRPRRITIVLDIISRRKWDSNQEQVEQDKAAPRRKRHILGASRETPMGRERTKKMNNYRSRRGKAGDDLGIGRT